MVTGKSPFYSFVISYPFVHTNQLRNGSVPPRKLNIFLRSKVVRFCASVFALPMAEVVELGLPVVRTSKLKKPLSFV